MSEKIKKDKPWYWPENKWREIVSRVSAGRSLNPKIWPGNADVTVAISFDSDHETSVLRWGSDSIGQISQGEYGSRKGIPRILEVLKQFEVKATFFVLGEKGRFLDVIDAPLLLSKINLLKSP